MNCFPSSIDEFQLEPCSIDVEDVVCRLSKVCSALRKTTSLASASITDSPRHSYPLFIADAQPDKNQSKRGVFFTDLGTKQGSMAIAMRSFDRRSIPAMHYAYKT